MRQDSGTVELLRRQFRHGEPALPLRHSARDALQLSVGDEPDADWIDDVLIVISELVQNVSQHTRGHGELILSVEAGTVLVEVGDTSTSVPHTRDPDPLRAGGQGLWLIEAVSQQWGVRTCCDGKVVWVKLPVIINVSVSSPRFHGTRRSLTGRVFTVAAGKAGRYDQGDTRLRQDWP